LIYHLKLTHKLPSNISVLVRGAGGVVINASSMRRKLTFFDTIPGKPSSVHCFMHSTLSNQSDCKI
jgi:hypothetical protein